MFRLIIKNLWHRRLRNGWLLAELILVTIVSWIILDPVVVDTYDLNRPLGYDADRLCQIQISELEEGSIGYDPSRAETGSDDKQRILEKLRRHPQVESATLLDAAVYPNSNSEVNRTFTRSDSVDVYVAQIWFKPFSDFFKTFGFKSADGTGSPSTEQLDQMSFGPSDIIITRSTAAALFPESSSIIGSEIRSKDYGNGSETFRIVGISEDVRVQSYSRRSFAMFKIVSDDYTIGSPRLLVRIRPGIDTEQFAADFRPWMVRELRSGNMFCRTIDTYSRINDNAEYQIGGNVITLKKMLAAFFLINLALGVVGTFWLQTRTRSQEIGVMRSFGATPAHIRAMLICEGMLLTVFAWITGCIIYLQWVIHEGLSDGRIWQYSTPFDTGWVCSFWPHFIGVSFIVLALMLAVVLLGIWLPARKLSRTDPVTVLHEE